MPNFSAWGIHDKYRDDSGHWREVPEESKHAVMEAMGAETDAPPEPALMVVRQRCDKSLPQHSFLQLEDGTRLRGLDRLPQDLPLGYHSLFDANGRETRLIVAPPRCYFPDGLHTWGWALQLYALRSRSSWGIGDLEDLRRISKWSAELGAGVIMINPLCATVPLLPQQPSPYYPSSRLYLNPLYLRIDKIPGAQQALHDLEKLSEQARILNDKPLIERDQIFKLKMDALEAIWLRTREQISFDEYEKSQGANLDSFATFCVLAEQYGANWREWPSQYRRPDDPAISDFSKKFSDRIRFHNWLQYLLDGQLESASSAKNIMQDFPIGVAPDGADAWMWQDIFAKDVRVGAPPDLFNANGQDWGLPPFVPHKLRAAGYEPFIKTIRAALRYAAGLRIDHVMGLFRLFWIPKGQRSAGGTYVSYNAEEMLAILALESVRAKTYIIGEDLGTVENGVREKLAEYSILSYRLLWFEEQRPELYPKLALAAVSTHDLPTIAGVWSGADFDEQSALGMRPNRENSDKMRDNIRRATNVIDTAEISDVIVKTHEALARSPSVITLASIEDGLAAHKRPNLPGANQDARPNWCIPLTKKLEDIETDDMVLKIAATLKRS
ncbi:MAG: 4-alpha-glucanotransferase [Acidobacteriota bacterium]|nr:4-alpha-glucanotransferase [Acidobacteriota bacterium]